jgi:hypothetical protein
VAAFLDDDPRNIRYMKRRLPWLLSIRILLEPRPSRRLIRTKLTGVMFRSPALSLSVAV